MIWKLVKDTSGSAAVEFALIGPTFVAMMLGVLQIGIGMQNYNAMRAVASDALRYAVVNYQTKNDLSNTQVRDYARSIAGKAPYGLESSRLAVQVDSIATSRVEGTLEKSLSMTYSVPTVISFFGFNEFPISYSQAVFLTTD